MNRFDLNSVSLDQQNASLCSTKWGVMSVLEDSKVEGDLVDIDYEIVHIIPASDEIKTRSVEFRTRQPGVKRQMVESGAQRTYKGGRMICVDYAGKQFLQCFPAEPAFGFTAFARANGEHLQPGSSQLNHPMRYGGNWKAGEMSVAAPEPTDDIVPLKNIVVGFNPWQYMEHLAHPLGVVPAMENVGFHWAYLQGLRCDRFVGNSVRFPRVCAEPNCDGRQDLGDGRQPCIIHQGTAHGWEYGLEATAVLTDHAGKDHYVVFDGKRFRQHVAPALGGLGRNKPNIVQVLECIKDTFLDRNLDIECWKRVNADELGIPGIQGGRLHCYSYKFNEENDSPEVALAEDVPLRNVTVFCGSDSQEPPASPKPPARRTVDFDPSGRTTPIPTGRPSSPTREGPLPPQGQAASRVAQPTPLLNNTYANGCGINVLMNFLCYVPNLAAHVMRDLPPGTSLPPWRLQLLTTMQTIIAGRTPALRAISGLQRALRAQLALDSRDGNPQNYWGLLVHSLNLADACVVRSWPRRCSGCTEVLNVPEVPEPQLIVHPQGPCTLEQPLQQVEAEPRTFAEPFTCNGCGVQANAETAGPVQVRYTVETWMVIALQQPEGGHPVTVPLQFNFGGCVCVPAVLVVQEGARHLLAYVRYNGAIFKCNDRLVQRVSDDTAGFPSDLVVLVGCETRSDTTTS